MIDSEYVEYHEKLDKKGWLEEAGSPIDGQSSFQAAWRLQDRDNLFSIAPNIAWSIDRAHEYLAVKSPASILIGESVRVLRQLNIEEFEIHLWFAAYQSKPIGTTQLQVDIEYYAIPNTEMGIGDNPVFQDVSILQMLGIDGLPELQPKQAVINKGDLDKYICESIKVLGFKSVSALISSSQQSAALASGDIHLQNGACSLHMGLMDKVTRVKSSIKQLAFTTDGIPYCDTRATWDLLFCLSVCPELIQPIDGDMLYIKMGGDSGFDTSKPGYMEMLGDIEGLYLVGNPADGVQQQIQARLDSDRSPPPNSYDALENSNGDVNHYTYEILGMTVIQRRGDAGVPADAPIYLYAIEECDNRYRGDDQQSIERLNNCSTWMRAEQIDATGKVLLSGDEAFWAAGINPDYLKDGADDEYPDYAAERATILSQLEARYLKVIVRHAQAMHERLYSLKSVYGNTPIMPKKSDFTDLERLVTNRRFEIMQMSYLQIEEYKMYSNAWHKFTEKGIGHAVAAGYIVVDHEPWNVPNLLEYSVITQVFRDEQADFSIEDDDYYLPATEVFLTDRYDCSMHEEVYMVYNGHSEHDSALQLRIDWVIDQWADITNSDVFCPKEISLCSNKRLLTIDLLNEIIGQSITNQACRNELRVQRQEGIANDVNQHYLERGYK